jgi:hypothetical protein
VVKDRTPRHLGLRSPQPFGLVDGDSPGRDDGAASEWASDGMLIAKGVAGAGMESGNGMAGARTELWTTGSSLVPWYITTALRPAFLASYSARSAAFTRSSGWSEPTSELPAQPMLAVTRTSSPLNVNYCLRRLESRRSATMRASVLLV